MRLLVRHLYRAYPELDRFTDEQCVRFVNAANRGVWRTLGRVVLITVVSAALLLGGVIAAGYAASLFDRFESRRLGTPFWVNMMRVVVTLPLMAAVPVGGFLARDLMLRWRLRYVLRSRSACPGCRYRLIGLAVTADHKITCPECGLVCDVDPSLSELAPDETGKERYHPSVIAPPKKKFWTAKRRRRFLWSAAAVILIPGSIIGGYEWWVERAATAALRARPGAAGLMALVERDQPVDAGPENGWIILIEASNVMEKADDRVWRLATTMFADGQELMPDPAFLISSVKRGPPPSAYDLACRDLAARMLDEYRVDGIDELLRKAAATRRAVRMLAETPNPLFQSYPTDLGQVRRVQRYCLERVAVAQNAHDTEGALDAIEWGLAVSRMLRQQAFGVDAMFAIVYDAAWFSGLRDILAAHPDAATLDRIERVLAAQDVHVPEGHLLEGEQIVAADRVAWFFSDPARIRLGRYSRAIPRFAEPNARGLLGSFAENGAVLDGVFAAARANAALLPKDRAAAVSSYDTRGLVLLTGELPNLDYDQRLCDEERLGRDALAVLIAMERFRNETGVYPKRLEEVVPKYLAATPLDPWSGRPLCFKRVDPANDVFRREFLLYSVGADGEDNGGVEQATDLQLGKPTAPGLDYVLNQPKRPPR